MTRKDLQEKYNILGVNKDLQLFRQNDDKHTGIGYCGSITLEGGKAVFNGKKYSDLDSLDVALREWEKTLDYPVDTYCPMYNKGWRTEGRIIWYLTEKLGFKAVHHNWDVAYEKPIGPSFSIQFYVENNREDDSKVDIVSKYGAYTFRSPVDNAEDGIASINTIVNSSVLEMAKDIVDAIAVCDPSVTEKIEAYVPSKKNFFGVERVGFKDLMIGRLEKVLDGLKNS